MDYRIKQLLANMRELKRTVDTMPMANLNSEAVKRGLEQSASTCRQQPYVFATPLMKNLLVAMGDVSQYQDANGEWHTEKLPVGKESKAVDWLNRVVDAARLKYNGPRVDHYDHELPIDSPKLYDTDCWLGWKETVWDIAPGQAEQRRKTFAEYGKAATNFTYQQMVKAVTNDKALQKAILNELEILPEVRAAREVEGISDPFMSKGTGVSYPDYRNDRTYVEGEDVTYGQHEINLAKAAWKKGLASFLKFGYDNNVYTGYPRNQRGKGRALEAQSRRTNLVINMVNGPEMEAWKAMKFVGAAFQDEDTIKQALIEMAETAKGLGCKVMNKDFTQWDLTVGEGWLILLNAMRMMRANGNTAKEIIKLRCACNCKSYLVDGPNGKVHPIYGRMMSGYLDTTPGNTSINRTMTRAGLYTVDQEYTTKISYPSHFHDIICVGDDIIMLIDPATDKQFVAAAKKFGFNAHADMKDAYGVMFIQYRLIQKDGKWIMAYNWPRVLRSMLSKEDQKGLGKAGWTLSFYQQLGKLRQYPEMMAIALNITAALDKDRLMLDTPIEEIKRMVEEEDEQIKKDVGTEKKNKQARIRPTHERLNYQPQFGGQFNEDGSIKYDYFADLQKELKSVYDPEFLSKLGFKAPDLSKIK